MRILVTGASGFVGRHLVASLRGDGNSVTTLARGDKNPSDATAFAGPQDLADLDAWPNWPNDLDAVVHLAALNPSRRQSATPEALAHANVAGTAALARRARREGVSRIVFLSSSNVHAPQPGAIREGDALRPQSPYARSKADAETAFWSELSGGHTTGCILRPAPVYGAGGRGNVAALVKLARLPLPLPIGGIGGERSLVAIDHLVSAIRLCLTSDGARGETFLVADDEPVSIADIVRALRRGWGRASGVVVVPLALRRRLNPDGDAGGWLGSFTIDSGHLKQRTGWRPQDGTESRLFDMAKRGEL